MAKRSEFDHQSEIIAEYNLDERSKSRLGEVWARVGLRRFALARPHPHPYDGARRKPGRPFG
jgi:hypothetical protein